MSETNVLQRLSLFAFVALAIALPASATEVTSFRWQGEDLLIGFSDSISYRVDLAESDTSQLVIRLAGSALPATSATGSELAGVAGRKGILTQSTPQELRLTITSSDRMGYGTIWRPYSHTHDVHTFRWRQLGYGEEQYFKALLAFEEKLDPQGIELLRIAYATGERRAASALGVYYARRGEYALAEQYLKSPVDADDHAALAAIDLHNGDTVQAAAHQHSFEQLLAQAPPRTGNADVPTESTDSPSPQPTNNTPTSMQQWISRENWPFIAAGVALILLLIYVIVRSMRRRPYTPQESVAAPVVTEPTATVEAPPEVFKPVVAEPVIAEPVVVEPVVAEPVVAEPVVAEPVVAEPVVAEPVVAEPTNATVEDAHLEQPQQSSSNQTPPRSTSTLSTQAAALRRRIEAMRSTAEPVAPPTTDDESIVSEARRLRLSRDSVELRKRLERTGHRG